MEVTTKSLLRMETVGGRSEDRFDHWIVYHLVWCTSSARQVLVGAAARACCDALDLCCREQQWDILFLNIRPDHVRISVRVAPSDSAAKVARHLMAQTAHAVRGDIAYGRPRAAVWNKTFYASTTSIGDIQVRAYMNVMSG